MPNFYANENDATVLREMARGIGIGQRTRGLANNRRPRLDSGAKVQGQLKGLCSVAVSGQDAIAIHQIELLWGSMPPDVPEGEPAPGGAFLVENIFEQEFNVGDIVVAFESDRTLDPVVIAPGHSNQSATNHAAQSAQEHAGAVASGTIEGTPEWWGFSPVAAAGTSVVGVTEAAGIPAASGGIMGSGTAKVWDGTPPNMTEGDQFTVYNWFENGAIAGNTKVTMQAIRGRYVINGEDCPL